MPFFRYPFFYHPNYYGSRWNRSSVYASTDNGVMPFHSYNNNYVNSNQNKIQNNDINNNKNHVNNRSQDCDNSSFPSNKKNNSKSNSDDENYFFELFGLKLYFDDILLICLIFFLYQEGVKDDELFLSLVLLLLS